MAMHGQVEHCADLYEDAHFESAVEGQEHQQYRKAIEWPQSGGESAAE